MADPYTDLRRAVLVDASEHWNGLHEAWWRANAMYPDMRLSERLAVAERVVHDLLSAGLIRLYRGQWQDTVPVLADGEPLPNSACDDLLRQYESWVPERRSPPLLIRTTSLGEREAEQ